MPQPNPFFTNQFRREKTDSMNKGLIALGSDHGGWELKEYIKALLIDAGYTIEDFSNPTYQRCDYPVIGIRVARGVSEGKIPRGILLCGTGIGMSITANRFPGVRAALCHDIYTARMSREHNNANILVLGGRILGKGIAEEILKVWLDTPFPDPDGRHSKRLAQIESMPRTAKEYKDRV